MDATGAALLHWGSRSLQAVHPYDDEACKVGTAMAVMYGLLGATWLVLLVAWAINVHQHRKKSQLLWFMFLVPIVQIGDSGVTTYSYTVCHCLVCHFPTYYQYKVWLTLLYTFRRAAESRRGARGWGPSRCTPIFRYEPD